LTIKIVITGATGFIGTALCKKLEEKIVYSLIKFTRTKKDKTGFFRVNEYNQVPFGDILIHLGEDPDRARVNKMGDPYRKKTGEVMEFLINKGYKKIIYCSSSIVYGDQGTDPYRENMPTYASDIYSTAKLENEKRVLNSDGIVIRFSNVIGNGMSKNNILSDILKQLPEQTPLTIRNLKPIRDFIWIDDAVDALVKLLQKEISGIFNIGSGEAVSIKQLTETVLNIAKQNREIKGIIENSEYSYNILNIEKIKKVTDWQPKSTLSQSVEIMVNNL
jgi:UDP-glucose 4-epimerase